MRLTEYRAEQNTITRQVVAAVVGTLRSLIGVPLNADQWRLLLSGLLPAMLQGRRASHLLAVRFVTEQRELFTTTAPPTLDVPPYDVAALDALLTRTVRARLAVPDTARAGITAAARAAVRHVEQAGRDTVITATERDPAALGWARVPTSTQPCAFCWMLASRGPVYGAREAAGAMTDWHDGCLCRVVTVYDPATWEGRDTYQAASRLWEQTTIGHSGRDALNAFRRALHANPITLP